MRDGKSNSKSKRESFTSASGLSALAPPFNFNSKTHDHEPSFNYNLEGVYDFNYGCDDFFEYESNSYLFLDGDASMAYNSIFKLDENTPYSSEINFSQVREIGASGDNTTLLLRELCFSENLDSCGDAAVNKENYAGRLSEVDVCADATVVKGKKYSDVYPSAVMELHVLQNATDMMACHKKILMDKGKEKQNCETVINEAIDTSGVGKKDPSPALPDEFKLVTHNGESFVPVQASLVMSDTNDSDLDSPCWKGTGFCQSAFRDPGPIISKLPKIEGVSRKSLNPLAPHFFPGSAKPLVDYHGNKFEENDSSSFKKDATSVALSSKEHRLTAFVKAGISSSEVSNAIETRFSNHDAGKEYSLPKKLNTNSVLNSSFSDGPCLVKEDLTFNDQDVTGANVSGSVKVTEPAILDSTNASFSPTGNLLTSIFPRDGAFSHFCERGASKSTTPKMDVQLVINTIHDLSELLRWNCSKDLSLNEHEHDMIHRIIDNLYVCITNKVQQRVSISESGHPCTSYCPVKLPDRHKEFQVTKIKHVTVAHDWETQKSLSANSHKKVLVSSSSSSSRSDEGIKIGDDVTRLQTVGKALKELKIVEEMHPRPLSNGDLWPDASDAPFLCCIENVFVSRHALS